MENGNEPASELSKREYFAGLAMQSLAVKLNGHSDSEDLIKLTKTCVIVADELLHQLSLSEGKKGEKQE